MILKTNTIVHYSYLHHVGHCRIHRVGDLTVYATDIHTGKELVMSKDTVQFSPATVEDPKAKQPYEIIDINYPEDDPEMVQVLFAHKDESVDLEEYVLNIIYGVSYESHPGNPNCWSSDMDYYGYIDCDAEVIDLQVYMHDPETYHRYRYSVDYKVDNIDIDDVMSTEDWKSIKRNVEENYCEYVKNLAEDL